MFNLTICQIFSFLNPSACLNAIKLSFVGGAHNSISEKRLLIVTVVINTNYNFINPCLQVQHKPVDFID